MNSSNNDEPPKNYIAFKILNYSENDYSYLIRPSQEVKATPIFQDNPTLRKVFMYLKIIIKGLDINVKSYMIKKILMTDEVMGSYKGVNTLLHQVMSHPNVKAAFEKEIDLAQHFGVKDTIPLKK